MAATYAVCCRIGVGLCFRLCCVVLQIGLRKAVTGDFTPIPVCYRQRVALVLHLRGCSQLVGGVVGEGLAEGEARQPRVGGGYLGHVADINSFDNMFFYISHLSYWSNFKLLSDLQSHY